MKRRNRHEQLKRNDAEYRRGNKREQVVIDKLRKLGWQVEPSSAHDNIVNDIDAVRTWDDKPGKLPISIKSLRKRTYDVSGSIMFELEVLIHKTQKWQKSWFHNGKATAYVIDIEQVGLLYISKAGLNDYVNEFGWENNIRNSRATVARQIKSGHPHEDAKGGLLQVATMLDEGFAHWLICY